ncbi:CPBP family intramembrane metalloprotease [Lactobacillus sp. ESL0684]|uniref:CPBP family intramembrane glutamic endopeptidase n=1 Tax=Lactobacillus sp. ESL0684 TaxID=2983213 RepID=UPI0023F6C755|nr:CPBP family intramembrane glutamic endopeptidase [Lactobacillus sp. ESL0684]WEV43204.1 CPBP family intramembrane metalloprotease [Lactobacillus sp. ESL0684]
MREKIFRKWHVFQTIAQMIFWIAIGIFTIINPNHLIFKKRLSNGVMCLMLLAMLILQLTISKPEKRDNHWTQLNHYLQVFLIGITLQGSVSTFLAFVHKYHILNFNFWTILATLYSLIMYLPLAQLALAKIKNNWGRMFMLAFVIFSFALSGPTLAGNSSHLYLQPLQLLNNSGVTGTIALLLITLPVMHEWGFASPHFKISRNAGLGVLTFIVLVIFVDIMFNSFNVSSSFKNLFTAWDFKFVKVSWMFTLEACEAGIAEEWLMRYCMSRLLMRQFSNSKNMIMWSVIGNGILFGLFHFGNIAGQPASATFEQMFSVASWALLMTAIYLYTDSLAINMVYHGIYDMLAFYTSGSVHEAVPDAFTWQIDILLFFIYASVAYFLISGKRKKTIELNLANNGI